MTYIYPDLVVVCEGESDKVIIAHLARRVLNENGVDRKIEILPAHGAAIIPRMVRAIEARMAPPSLAIVVDSDGHPAKVWSLLRAKLPWNRYSLVIAHPTVEAWIRGTRGGESAAASLAQIADRISLHTLELTHPEFGDFKEVVLSHPGSVVHPKWVRGL
jgi:hypothetical protein